jgi:hypothetical protein
VQLYSVGEITGQILRVMLHLRQSLQDKKQLPVWYDGRR